MDHPAAHLRGCARARARARARVRAFTISTVLVLRVLFSQFLKLHIFHFGANRDIFASTPSPPSGRCESFSSLSESFAPGVNLIPGVDPFPPLCESFLSRESLFPLVNPFPPRCEPFFPVNPFSSRCDPVRPGL